MTTQGAPGSASLMNSPTPSTPATPTTPAAPPNKFVISSATCTVVQLRLMCAALSIPDKGTHTVVKERILSHIRARKMTTAELYAMPAMLPAFTRRASKKAAIRRPRAASTVGFDKMVVDETAPTQTALPAIPGPIDAISVADQRPGSPNSFPMLLPEAASLHSLALAFNESQKRQQGMQETISKMVASQNQVIHSVNVMGQAIYPLMKDTRELMGTMKLIQSAMLEIAEERENMESSIADFEQTTTDLVQEISEVTAAHNARSKDLDATIDDIRLNLSETMDTTKLMETKTEWLDRGQRAHNMCVFGWEQRGNPLEDARSYFTRIDFPLAESFLAYRGQESVQDGVVRPGVLKITFNSIPTCHRALEAARAHSKDRSIIYYAKQDRTKEQERLKRAADDGVRILRTRYAERDFRERSGKIAEFVAGPDGRRRFARWVPPPQDGDEIMAK